MRSDVNKVKRAEIVVAILLQQNLANSIKIYKIISIEEEIRRIYSQIICKYAPNKARAITSNTRFLEMWML